MAVDFETRLDSALDQIAHGMPSQAVADGDPKVADLLVVAERLQALAPVPAPDLLPGKTRLLQQAAQRRAPRAIQTLNAPRFRLALAVAILALLAIIIGNIVFFQIPAGVVRNPTFTATPTRLSLGREMAPRPLTLLSHPASDLAPAPSPVPVPDRFDSISRDLISSSQSLLELFQCRS